LEDQAKPDDLIFSYDGATLAVDQISFEFVKGAQVDYVQELIGAAFVIKNPNASSSCGCGSSFSI
jgi:iron-sulfur cluster insertion protein